MTHEQMRLAFAQPDTFLVKLTPDGFRIDGQDYEELSGFVARIRLVRKLFDDGELACHSNDGVTAENGTLCDRCRHPRCRAGLRLLLAEDARRYLLDLNATSAQNLFALEDRLKAQDAKLAQQRLILTVRNRGHWGEVLFQCQP